MVEEQQEVREQIYGYTATGTFKEKFDQPCRFRTARCPNDCGHGGPVFTFHLEQIEVYENPDSK